MDCNKDLRVAFGPPQNAFQPQFCDSSQNQLLMQESYGRFQMYFYPYHQILSLGLEDRSSLGPWTTLQI